MDGTLFGILGPLSIGRAADEIRLAGARRRVLLVRLLVSANDVVPVGRLIEDLWDGQPPAGAASTLQSHVSALRHALGRDRVQHRDGGYVLAVADGELDVQLFEQEAAAAQRAAKDGDFAGAVELWSRALNRWRGLPLSDVAGMDWAAGEATRLQEQRSRALEAWLGARLELGDHAGVASDAERAVAEDPLREGLWANLMVGLYRSGRQSDALRAYQRLRRVLRDELGIDPSPELAHLEQAVLLHEPELQWQAPAADQHTASHANSSTGPTSTATRCNDQLPAGTVTFLATNIDGSSRLLRDHGAGYAAVLRRHREVLRKAAATQGGIEVHATGDGALFVFSGTGSAIAAALSAQLTLASEPWPDGMSPRVQMGLHTGEAEPEAGDYVAIAVHQATEVALAAHGGQILVSDTTAMLGGLPSGASIRDLGLYRLPTFEAPVRIRQVCSDALSSDFPRLRARPAVVGNLPAAVSSFVGRADEVAQVNKLLGANRLLTLIGPGGTGKTRLALETASRCVDEFVDAVWFIDLAPVNDPAMVAAVVADTVGVRQQAGRRLSDVLAAWVSDQHVLFIFDNCEHVIQTSAELIERLLTSGPRVKVLATSRERLRINGETLWHVPPLALPDTSPEADVDAVMYADSVRLFIDRALAVRADQPLDPPSLASIAEVVIRLDGLPLAIELAAARVDQLSVRDIADRLDNRFRLLVEGSRTALPRQQTLRGAIDWSFQLLDPRERAVLRRLSVFAGSFTLPAAASVTSDDGLVTGDIAEIVLGLAAKSLVVRMAPLDQPTAGDRAMEARFRLLETIRQYAAEQLEGCGEDEAGTVRDRHGDHYLDLARRAESDLYGPDQGRVLEMLELEHDNIRLVLDRFSAHPDRRSSLLEMVGALRRFWHTHNHHGECLSYLTPALDQCGSDVPDSVRAPALNLAAEVVRFSDTAVATRYGEEALALARRLGDDVVTCRSLSKVLAFAAVFRGEHDAALSMGEEAVEVANRSGDLVLIGEALVALAIVAQDDFPRSQRLNEEALRASDASGDLGNAAFAHSNLGNALLAAGDIERARTHIEQAIAIFADLDSQSSMSMINLGWVFLQQGDPAAATATFRKAMQLARRSAMRTDIAYSALGLALCASATGRWERAAAMHAFADQEVAEIGHIFSEPERSYRLQDLERVRQQLDGRLALAYSSVRETSRDKLLQLALDPATDDAPSVEAEFTGVPSP